MVLFRYANHADKTVNGDRENFWGPVDRKMHAYVGNLKTISFAFVA